MAKVLIIPDVHCRDFYIEPLEKYSKEVDKVVFLGDYLDPYYYEGFTREDGIKRLGNIIELKNKNPDKVILLLGNHDCHYTDYLGKDIRPCSRYDFENEERNNITRKLFKLNKDKFQLLYKIDNVLFSHAGVMIDWLIDCGCSSLDELLNDESKAYGYLWEVSYMRGGDFDYGSCVWNDVREFENKFRDIYQVFGHTQLQSEPIIENDYACLDCRRAFIIDTVTNKIEEA